MRAALAVPFAATLTWVVLGASACQTADGSFSASPASLEFGAVTVGESDRQVTLVRGGCETPLSWYAGVECRSTLEFALEGEHASSFSFSLEPTPEFTASRDGNRATFIFIETVEVAVTFTPKQSGELTASVVARLVDAPFDSPLVIPLRGTGR